MDFFQLVDEALLLMLLEAALAIPAVVVVVVDRVLPLALILLFHALLDRTQIPRLFQTLNRRLAFGEEVYMPRREPGKDQAYDPTQNSQQDDVDQHDALLQLRLVQDVGPHPLHRRRETQPTEQRGVGKKQQKGLVVAQSHARR